MEKLQIKLPRADIKIVGLLSPTEAATRLGVSPQLLSGYVRRDLLHPVTVGDVRLYAEHEVEQLAQPLARVEGVTIGTVVQDDDERD